MNTVVWVVQCFLTAIFAIAGFVKLVTPKDILEEKMSWVKDYSNAMVTFIGTCEFMGAIGLVAPMALNIFPFLTPIAATGLAIIMILAVIAQIKRKEYKKTAFALFLLIFTVLVAVNRF